MPCQQVRGNCVTMCTERQPNGRSVRRKETSFIQPVVEGVPCTSLEVGWARFGSTPFLVRLSEIKLVMEVQISTAQWKSPIYRQRTLYSLVNPKKFQSPSFFEAFTKRLLWIIIKRHRFSASLISPSSSPSTALMRGNGNIKDVTSILTTENRLEVCKTLLEESQGEHGAG